MKGRVFTPEFKQNVVKGLLSGEKRVVQLCRELSVSTNIIHNWKKVYLEKGEAAFTQSFSTAREPKPQLSAEEQELLALRQKEGVKKGATWINKSKIPACFAPSLEAMPEGSFNESAIIFHAGSFLLKEPLLHGLFSLSGKYLDWGTRIRTSTY
jgi:transposase